MGRRNTSRCKNTPISAKKKKPVEDPPGDLIPPVSPTYTFKNEQAVIKKDNQFNEAGPEGLWSEKPRQASGIGAYRICMGQGHEVDGMHMKDEATGLTRFWCKVCGWDLSLIQADKYMNARMDK